MLEQGKQARTLNSRHSTMAATDEGTANGLGTSRHLGKLRNNPVRMAALLEFMSELQQNRQQQQAVSGRQHEITGTCASAP